ncbi:hypothetical protein AAHA92_32252 [Salvia divinorum]|uniref:Uncharacterized protein n=1 Tax=Salvia divinorum TaxID=28513 RepID=A0ABD1FNF5_SALDI
MCHHRSRPTLVKGPTMVSLATTHMHTQSACALKKETIKPTLLIHEQNPASLERETSSIKAYINLLLRIPRRRCSR